VPADWGSIVDPADIEAALKAEKKVKMVAVVHAETSTGVLQPLEEISRLAKEYDALFLADTVTSLGGAELAIDDWGIDISYSGSQKCLGCPPGLAPFTVNKKALNVVLNRSTKVPSWYLDLSLLLTYWTNDRFYHHTAPISMVYALYESLRMVLEEGMEERIKRHQLHGDALKTGLEAMGLELHAQEGHRLSMLTTVRIPSGVDDAAVRKGLLNGFNLEIGGGLGPLKGLVWRVGLMGFSSNPENVLLVLASLEKMLTAEGYRVESGAGVKAAVEYMKKH
jgi:alanine-glyoxylate transaminase/serine-glyoxylate transaminase/serine-pyruvate transaminase